MIGKVSVGKGYAGCISYLFEGKSGEKKELSEVLHYNNCYGDKNELIQQFNDVRVLNKKIEKPVWHTSLSFAHNDKLTNQQLVEIADKLAKKFNFKDKQYLVIKHNDTKHQHIHIVANRVGFNGKAIQTNNNYKKISEFCRSMEKEYNLEKVLSPNRFLDKNRNLVRDDIRKNHVKDIVKEAMLRAKDLNEFKSIIENKNLKVQLGRGIAFFDKKGVKVKGSQIGFSLGKIQKVLSYSKIYRPEILAKKVITKILDHER